jgi:hypothetical protein
MPTMQFSTSSVPIIASNGRDVTVVQDGYGAITMKNCYSRSVRWTHRPYWHDYSLGSHEPPSLLYTGGESELEISLVSSMCYADMENSQDLSNQLKSVDEMSIMELLKIVHDRVTGSQ